MVLEEGCALIQAGMFFQRRDWQQIGTNIVTFVYAHAYIPQYHTFADQMDAVLLPDGTVNPDEQFYTGQTRNYTVDGSATHMGEISQIAISLLDTYSATHEQSFLARAIDLLDTYSLPANLPQRVGFEEFFDHVHLTWGKHLLLNDLSFRHC